MPLTEYQQRIVQYYRETEHAYKDSWDLENSLSIHYGYRDGKVHNFRQSLLRMNEIMAEAAVVGKDDKVLDAGCGVGGGSIFLASERGCHVTGISLSERQVRHAREAAKKKGVEQQTDFRLLDYCATGFPDESFDVVWGCESICYADSKEQFIREAFRLLKPGGRLIVADGFVAKPELNQEPVIRKWLDGWQVNYLESPGRFKSFMEQAGFKAVEYRDISKETAHSSRRLFRFYWLASLYILWKKLCFSRPPSEMQKKNIQACRYQYLGRKRKLWQYGLILGRKP